MSIFAYSIFIIFELRASVSFDADHALVCALNWDLLYGACYTIGSICSSVFDCPSSLLLWTDSSFSSIGIATTLGYAYSIFSLSFSCSSLFVISSDGVVLDYSESFYSVWFNPDDWLCYSSDEIAAVVVGSSIYWSSVRHGHLRCIFSYSVQEHCSNWA